MQEGIKNGREIMRQRLLNERKEELEKNLKKDKNYVVCATLKFEGKFSHIEQENDDYVAVFVQPGRTDRGTIPKRRILVSHLVSAELKKT